MSAHCSCNSPLSSSSSPHSLPTAHTALSDTTDGEAFSPFPAPFLLSTASPSLLQPCLTPIDHAARLDATHDPETGCPSPRNDSFERSAARLDPRWRRPWRSRRTAKRYACRDRRHALPTSSLDSFPAPIDTQARSLHAYVHTNAASRSERRPFKTTSSRRTDSTPFISTDSLWSGPRLSANRFGRRAKQPARLLVIDAHRLEPGYRFVR